MSQYESLNQREADAERARLKLQNDLKELRSPDTFVEFKQVLTQETIRAKDEVIANITSNAKSTFDSFVEDVKGKATANPGAALAIGAGLAWHFSRKPPITTALIGLGLYSLLRTRPSTYSGLAQAGENLKGQVGDLVVSAGEAANVAKDAIKAKAVEVVDVGKEKLAELATSASEHAEAAKTQATRSLHDTRDTLSDGAQFAVVAARDTLEEVRSRVSATKVDSRDALLLGIAGIAVSAAVGVSLQRRLTHESR